MCDLEPCGRLDPALVVSGSPRLSLNHGQAEVSDLSVAEANGAPDHAGPQRTGGLRQAIVVLMSAQSQPAPSGDRLLATTVGNAQIHPFRGVKIDAMNPN
jgi:hypothetical protein